MTYISQYQQRKHVIITGKVESVERYDTYYDIVFGALKGGFLPTITLPAGQILLRKSNRDIEQSRTIPPNSAMSLKNRYSGIRLDGKIGQGALYTGTIAGILREHVHYSLADDKSPPSLYRPGISPDRTRNFLMQEKHRMPRSPAAGPKLFHAYRAKRAMVFADFRLQSLSGFFTSLRQSPAAYRKFGIVNWSPTDFQIQAVNDPVDYSAARGMADAAFDAGKSASIRGVCSMSARADSEMGLVTSSHGDITTGLVFAIFGPAGTLVNELQPIGSFGTFRELSDGLAEMQGFAIFIP